MTSASSSTSSSGLRRRFNRVFVLTVALPTALAAVYYGLIASDVYISESRFVVRSPERPSQVGLGALLQGTALSRSQDESYSVQSFILSRDALTELDQKLSVRQAYGSKDIDVFNRFPGLDPDDSFEAFHRYYQNRVGINYDTSSSISVLSVSAYTAQQARDINEALLVMGERLVNNLNNRSRQDLIDVAQREVAAAEERSRAAAQALSQFRSKGSVFDPNAQSALQLQGVAKLREELLAAEAQLSQVRKLSPRNPQIGSLTSRVEELRRSMAEESGRVTGNTGSLSAKSPVYERLQLEKTFADQQLGASMVSLETARREAARKQLYLERLVQPNLPDRSVEPRRLRSVFTVLAIGLIAWGVISLVLASVREHMD
jgi:capsular polysaccharide transport system permease protein